MSSYMSLAHYMAGTPVPDPSLSVSRRFGSVTYDPLLPAAADPMPSRHIFSSVVLDPPDPPDFLYPGGSVPSVSSLGRIPGMAVAKSLLQQQRTKHGKSWSSTTAIDNSCLPPSLSSTVVGLPGVHVTPSQRQTRRYGSLESDTSLVSEEGLSSGGEQEEVHKSPQSGSFTSCSLERTLSGSINERYPSLIAGVDMVRLGGGDGRRRGGSLSDSPVSSAGSASSVLSSVLSNTLSGSVNGSSWMMAEDTPQLSVHELAAVPSALDTVLEITKQVINKKKIEF